MIYICEKWVFRHRKYRVYFELRLIDGKKCEARGPTAVGLPFSIPIYMGKPSGPYGARLWGVCCCAPTSPVDCMGSFCQSSDLDAPSDVPDKGTNVGVRLGCHVRIWDCGGVGGSVTGPYLGLRRGRRGRDGSVFGTAEGW